MTIAVASCTRSRIANGDILLPEKAKHICHTRADAIMIGRAARTAMDFQR